MESGHHTKGLTQQNKLNIIEVCMNNKIDENNMAEVVNLATSIINEYFPECDAKKMVLQHLRILNRFEMNMYAITMAMMKIRGEAQIDSSKKFNSDELLLSLEKIEIIADNMHNVGAFLARGKACDAMSMLYVDVDRMESPKVEGVNNKQGN
jgi:hypothetical protein